MECSEQPLQGFEQRLYKSESSCCIDDYGLEEGNRKKQEDTFREYYSHPNERC